MKAFTYICFKINISIMNQTLTIYPNTISTPYSIDNKSEDIDSENSLINTGTEVSRFLTTQRSNALIGAPCLNIKGYIKPQDADHDWYHQDNFSKEQQHYHIKFEHPINEKLFNQILGALCSYNLITTTEMISLKTAYKDANLLKGAEPLSAKIDTAAVKPILISKSPSFSDRFFKLTASLIETIPTQPFMPKLKP